MAKRSLTQTRRLMKTALCTALVVLPILGTACSFNPASYFAKNACDVLNCDDLFFIEDLFPLSKRPTSGGGGESAAVEEVDDDGGHGH